MFIRSGGMYAHFQHSPGVLDLEAVQLLFYLAVNQFPKFFFPHPYYLGSQAYKDQRPHVTLVLRKEDLVKALENRSPRKFNLRNHLLLPADFLDGKNKAPNRRWIHLGTPLQVMQEHPGFLLLHDIKVLWLLRLEESVGALSMSYLHAGFQESHSGSPSSGHSVLQGFPNVQSQLLCQVKAFSLLRDNDRIRTVSLPLLNLPFCSLPPSFLQASVCTNSSELSQSPHEAGPIIILILQRMMWS